MILQRWDRFWFSKAPYFDLAFIRLLIVGLQLYLMLKGGYSATVAAVDLPVETFVPLPVLKIFMLPWGWGAMPDDLVVFTIFWGTLVAGMMAFIGLFTNLSLFLFAVGSIFLQGFAYSFGEQHHSQAIMMIALLVFSFGPCGKVLSVDSYFKSLIRKHNGEVKLLDYGSVFAGWPIKLMMCVFGLIYLSAIVSKLTHGGVSFEGLEWVNGYTLQFYLVRDGLRWGSELSVWFGQFHNLIYYLQIVVLVFQATFFLVIFFPTLRWVYLPAGLLFHFGIFLTLRAPFPEWIVLYSLFVPWSRVFEWLASTSTGAAAPEELERQAA